MFIGDSDKFFTTGIQHDTSLLGIKYQILILLCYILHRVSPASTSLVAGHPTCDETHTPQRDIGFDLGIRQEHSTVIETRKAARWPKTCNSVDIT